MTICVGDLITTVTELCRGTKPAEYGPDKPIQTPDAKVEEESAIKYVPKHSRGGLDGIPLGEKEIIIG